MAAHKKVCNFEIDMKKLSFILLAAVATLCSCRKEAKLEMNFSDRFEGKTVELVNYCDSTLLAEIEIRDGKGEFKISESDSVQFPLLTAIQIDGRVRAFYIAEEGRAFVTDSLNTAVGTAANDRLNSMLAVLDSIENADNMPEYIRYAEDAYNANKSTPIGNYFGIEWMKYSDPQHVDSMLRKAPEEFRNLRRVKYYENLAQHRAATSPGHKYTDFRAEDVQGRTQSLSSLLIPGHYTLIDFWASWCPYCIKELPEMIDLYNEFHDKGLDIVGVAVRDKPADTRAMVEKKEIPWPVMYNAQRIPYDIYGFTGIPHHILLGPDGTIISRGENIAAIRQRLQE